MFEEIIGHDRVVMALKKAVNSDRLPPSLMFEGIEGVGKYLTARSLAGIVVHKGGMHYHPDIKTLETGERTIKIDDIRNMRSDIYIEPYSSESKVYIIRDAEKMTAEAQNSFLKILEEPPEYAVIILTCNNINNILPTIKSRCVIYHFDTLNLANMSDILKSQGLSGELRYLIGLSGGSVSKTIDLINSEETKKLLAFTIEIISHVMEKDLYMLERDAQVIKDREDIFDLLKLIKFWYMDIVYAKYEMYDIMSYKDEKRKAMRFSDMISIKDLYESFDIIDNAKDCLNRNVNTLSTVLDMLVSLQELI